MIAHRGIRLLRGFQGDPTWITPETPTIGALDRAIQSNTIAPALARRAGASGLTPSASPAEETRDPLGGVARVDSPTSAGAASQSPATPAGGPFSRAERGS